MDPSSPTDTDFNFVFEPCDAGQVRSGRIGLGRGGAGRGGCSLAVALHNARRLPVQGGLVCPQLASLLGYHLAEPTHVLRRGGTAFSLPLPVRDSLSHLPRTAQ
ncbi:Histidinol dehydrogenase [Frankliniella fusca]|uniref:Histidinol dehydrogenase n=1 Tax=Frankliniella fusca TaxID=407009 RepID=A0AAE1HFV4_9NEOP|nr:Histidinol dehydrogenase [Frankliniella fusca]